MIHGYHVNHGIKNFVDGGISKVRYNYINHINFGRRSFMFLSSPHIVAIKNGINFRDLGGIKTKDGRKIRTGLLFRSGDFSQITDEEQAFIEQKLAIKAVLDYRDNGEAQHRPDKLWHSVQYFNVPANPLSDDVSANLTKELTETNDLKQHSPADFMIKLYQLLPFNNPAYQTLVDLLVNGNGKSIVQHCAIGKDRTGIGVALTLLALGVEEEQVMQDYILSEKLLAPVIDQIFAKYQGKLDQQRLEKRKQIFAANPLYLQAAFDAIKARYNTFDHWLENDYQLTDEKRQVIQRYYLI